MQYGDRIGAILEVNEAPSCLIGYGIYGGERDCPTSREPMPKLIFDRGGYLWGNQCLWGSQERIRKEVERKPLPDLEEERYFSIMTDKKLVDILRSLKDNGHPITKRLTHLVCEVLNLQFGSILSTIRNSALPVDISRQVALLSTSMELSTTMTGLVGSLDLMSPSTLTDLMIEKQNLKHVWEEISKDVHEVVVRHMSKYGINPIDLVAFGRENTKIKPDKEKAEEGPHDQSS